MGCDIHSIAQVKMGKSWTTIDCRIAKDARNYNVFAVLADIRNEDNWSVLFPARGLPEDVGPFHENSDDCLSLPEAYYYPEDKEKINPKHYFWIGDYGHSHLTLSELKKILNQFEGNKIYVRHGQLTEKQTKDLKSGKLPTHWVTDSKSKSYIDSEWEIPLIEVFAQLRKIVEEIDVLAKEYGVGEEDIRYVFGFDS